ncbi:triose-phosphate isomerase [Basfia succiniciproducens]|uniref:Triosephosphate isomerase n=1 Tax=Basfia succiniciproducens TaxID=653940 RepID=A0A1G5AAL4_9PAST|nr:triose-phosphate isomerase [Basfia succiniciproducens]QIM68414.1 triose-phosphate isomerase [Basfia succiniciproducens]SCX74898.1 triosephosphate isomerase /PTS system IIB component, Glc family [Basfia succiniciproducens]
MTAKKIYFGTNLKMYKGNAEVVQYLSELSDFATTFKSEYDIQLFVIPSYTTLKDAVELVKSKTGRPKIKIGAQNMNPNDNGQFTGEISPLMLKELGIELVMIGHSERRHVMKETDQEENEKVLASLKHNFITLLCIGETLEQKNYNISDEVLRTQLKIGLQGVTAEQLSKLWIAYEPVWAIGTEGIPASAEYADEKHAVIKQCLFELFAEESKKIPVLYGGSVNPENANGLIVKPHIDGLFVGRSAWNAPNFHALITDALNTLSGDKTEVPLTNEFTETAVQLIEQLGGKANISALTHCATRIRVVLKNDGKMNKSAIEKIDGVKGLFSITNQYQIILGAEIVKQVHDEMKKLLI